VRGNRDEIGTISLLFNEKATTVLPVYMKFLMIDETEMLLEFLMMEY